MKKEINLTNKENSEIDCVFIVQSSKDGLLLKPSITQYPNWIIESDNTQFEGYTFGLTLNESVSKLYEHFRKGNYDKKDEDTDFIISRVDGTLDDKKEPFYQNLYKLKPSDVKIN